MGVTHSRLLGKIEARQRPGGKCSKKHGVLYLLKLWLSTCLGPSRFCLATEGHDAFLSAFCSLFLGSAVTGGTGRVGCMVLAKGVDPGYLEYSKEVRKKCERKKGVSGHLSVMPGLVVTVKEDQSHPMPQMLRTPLLIKASGAFSHVYHWLSRVWLAGTAGQGITTIGVSKGSRTLTCTSPPCLVIHAL